MLDTKALELWQLLFSSHAIIGENQLFFPVLLGILTTHRWKAKANSWIPTALEPFVNHLGSSNTGRRNCCPTQFIYLTQTGSAPSLGFPDNLSSADGEIPLSLLWQSITALGKKGTFASEAWYLSFVGFSDVATERRGETEACKGNGADNL